jgi:uncharacterized membrane protein SpoIIM required for sporulation
MILDLPSFLERRRPDWERLEAALVQMESMKGTPSLDEIREFHRLYQDASADLARLSTFSAERAVRGRLESLVARAYAELHETRGRDRRVAPLSWLLRTVPRTFRRHALAFAMSVGMTLLGALFGAGAMLFAPDTKPVLMPFEHLLGDPSERVKEEERRVTDVMEGHKAGFSAELMTHNIRVSLLTFSTGITWGVGTVLLLFYNGVGLGAIVVDYLAAGQGRFLAGWLLPHGVIEIPAILMAGQAGIVLASALLGRGHGVPLARRMRDVSGDLLHLLGGMAVMLVWAGLVESFLSQYHEPVLPYEMKIGFGLVELAALVLWLGWGGRSGEGTP